MYEMNRPGRTLYNDQAGQEGFKQDAEFLETALQLADDLASGHGANKSAK